MERTHALLSASSAEKWLNCTPSAKMEEPFEDNAGESAAEGTLAHELAESKARLYFRSITKAEYANRIEKIKSNALYSAEMDRHTTTYLEYLKDIEAILNGKPYVIIETAVDYSPWVPEGFGTVDCIMISGKELHVIDFKYGKTIFVSANNNPQLRLYALGAYNRYGMLYDIQSVAVHIVQPRMENVNSEEITAEELMGWADNIVKPQAGKAFKGEGSCIVGKWCDSHFCRARPVCRAYIGRIIQIEPYTKKSPGKLTNAEIGQALTVAKEIKKWYSILEGYAQKAILSGKKIDGWKLVEGRSNRAFDDVAVAFKEAVTAGVDEALLYERRPITLTECEKIFGKKEFSNLFGSHVIKPPGKPTLVPDSDPRSPYCPAAADFGTLV